MTHGERLEFQPLTADSSEYSPSEPGNALLSTEPYRFFGQAGAEEYYQLSREITTYIHDEGVRSVVLADKAARPAYVGLLQCWRELYRDEDRPLINFMNPLGLQTVENVPLFKRVRGAIEHVRAGSEDVPVAARTVEDIAEEFRVTFAALMRRKDDPVLVLDTCLHTGESALPILTQLLRHDFADVRIGVVAYEPLSRPLVLVPDIVFRTDGAVEQCYPFGYRERMVAKTFDRVTSIQSGPADREAGRALRVEAARIIAEGLRRSWYIEMTPSED
jgi:hypothetical protein